MPKFEVDATFTVEAENSDKAYDIVRAYLSESAFDYFSGIRDIALLEDCVTEVEDEDA